jgi:GT2 family glycosyltransferase
VGGSYRTLNKNSLIARFAGYEIEERHKALSKKRFVDFIGTFSASYRKNIFTKFGGFDTSFTTSSGEDPELSFRINKTGLKMVFQPKAFVYHKHPDTIQKFLRQKFWRGFWRVFTYKKHSDKMFRHSYTPKSIFIEEALTGASLLLLFLGFLNFLPIYYGLTFFIITFLLTLPFSIKIFFKDIAVGCLSPWITILRNLFTGFGIVAGILNLLFRKSK